MQQRDISTSPPRAPVPLEEFGRHSLLRRGIYLAGDLFGGNIGGGVFHLYMVWVEYRSVVTTKGVGLGHHKVVVVGGQRRHEAWLADFIAHCEGLCRTR